METNDEVQDLERRCSALYNRLQKLDAEEPLRDDPRARLELFQLELRHHQLTRTALCSDVRTACGTCKHVANGPCGRDCPTCENYPFYDMPAAGPISALAREYFGLK
ncbi:MAG: hypothetical protein ABR861_12730 [Terriglobales bacterium]|jgi:hypothetical protein